MQNNTIYFLLFIPVLMIITLSNTFSILEAQEVKYELTNLGTLGGLRSQAYGINAAGQVVGFATPSGQWRAFLWQDGMMANLGTLDGNSSMAYGINDAGQVVGQSSNADNELRAFLWQNGTMIDLETLGGMGSGASGVNIAGQVVGWARNVTGQVRAFLWQDDTMTNLGTLGGNWSEAYSINDAGQVVGAASNVNIEDRAFLWQNGTMTNLGTLGGNLSHAYGINAVGQVVGFALNAHGVPRAFVWQNGTMTDLGALGGHASEAYGINAAGHVVGRAQNANNQMRAFLWQDGNIFDLNDLIDPVSGWILTDARDINESGMIVGWGIYEGHTRAFLLTPTPGQGVVTDVRFVGGNLPEDPFEGVSARLSRGEEFLDLVLTDDAGIYEFTDAVPGELYDLRITDNEEWGIERLWTGLELDELHKDIRLPASMMRQLFDLADSLKQRRYSVDSTKALIKPYERWAGIDATEQMALIDMALAHLIIAHQTIGTMYDNTGPVAEELATAIVELFVFAVGLKKNFNQIRSTERFNELGLTNTLIGRFQQEVTRFAIGSFTMVTDQLIAQLPDSQAELKYGLKKAVKLLLKAVESRVTHENFSARGVIKSIIADIVKVVGDYALMELYASLTREDLDHALDYAKSFNLGGSVSSSYQNASQAGISNFVNSDNAVNFSRLTRETASDIDDISGVTGMFIRMVSLARILRIVQLGGYLAAVGRTGFQYYDTIANDLPEAVQLSMGHAGIDPDGDDLIALESLQISPTVSTADLSDLNASIDQYLQRISELTALISNDDRNGVLNALEGLFDASDVYYNELMMQRLPLLAVADAAYREIENYQEPNGELMEALSESASRHLEFLAYIIGYLDEDPDAEDIQAPADSLYQSFQQIVPMFETIYDIVKDIPVPAFVAVTDHYLSADSVNVNTPFTIHARIVNAGGFSASDVTVQLEPDTNMTVTSQVLFEIGELGQYEEKEFEWTVLIDNIEPVSSYIVQLTSSNGRVQPAAGAFEVSGSIGVSVDDNDGQLPVAFRLHQNYPNPFNPATIIQYDIPSASNVLLEVFNVLGQRVAVLADGYYDAGSYNVQFNAAHLPSGVYLYRIQAEGFSATKKLMLVR